MLKPVSIVVSMFAVQLCVCVYALRQAAGCVKTGLGPAAS